MRIAVLNQKGGVGKTTLATHLAVAFAHDGQRVLLVDADPQGSSANWAAARRNNGINDEITCVSLARDTLHHEVGKLSEGYDVVVIDGPARLEGVARAAIVASDVVLLPVRPNPDDIWSAGKAIETCREAAPLRPDLQYAFVVTQKVPNSALGREVNDALKEFYDVEVLAHIGHRVAFPEAYGTGETVLETEPGSRSAKEILHLVDRTKNFAGEEAAQ